MTPSVAVAQALHNGENEAEARVALPEDAKGVALQFTERTQPRLIHTADDAPAEGTFWLDLANGGRIVKTEIRIQK